LAACAAALRASDREGPSPPSVLGGPPTERGTEALDVGGGADPRARPGPVKESEWDSLPHKFPILKCESRLVNGSMEKKEERQRQMLVVNV
jgi:hypothetical protein